MKLIMKSKNKLAMILVYTAKLIHLHNKFKFYMSKLTLHDIFEILHGKT